MSLNPLLSQNDGYSELIDELKPVVAAVGMSELNRYSDAVLHSQVLKRIALLDEARSNLTDMLTDLGRVVTKPPHVFALENSVYQWKVKNWGYLPEFSCNAPTRTSSVAASAFSASIESLESSLASLDAEYSYVVKYLPLLDTLNTLDHRSVCPHNPEKFAITTWRNYISERPAKKVRDDYHLFKIPSKEDEASILLKKVTLSSRRNFIMQRVLREFDIAHQNGWYIVFDTLTLDSSKVADFYADTHALRDHFRNIGRSVLAAEGRSVKGSFDDCFRYFCAPEYGSANGRLHFHCVYFLRTLPRNSIDPNLGRRFRNRCVIDSFRTGSLKWNYGFSAPIAVFYSGCAFSRIGWFWPQGKDGKARESKPYLAVARYVTKYVCKTTDQQSIKSGLHQKSNAKWVIQCQQLLNTIPKNTFRIRMSRSLGLSLPTMANLSIPSLVQATQLNRTLTEFPLLMKRAAKRELRLRMANLSHAVVTDAKPPRVNLLEHLRASILKTQGFSLLSSTLTMTPSLTSSDISSQLRDYLNDNALTPRKTNSFDKCFGSK